MAIYRNVQLSFWTDNKVEDDFTPEDKYFYLYLLTNPQTNICGCYEVSFKQMCTQTGYNKDTIERLIKRFEKTHDLIRYSETTKEILILNWHKYNWSKSPKAITGIESVAKHIKYEPFKNYIFALMKGENSIEYIYPIEASVSDTVSISVSDSVSDTDIDNKKHNKNNIQKENNKMYFENEILNNTFLDFIDMRKKIKKPMSDRAITLAVNKVKKLATMPFSDEVNEELAIKIIEQSILGSWSDLYPLKQDKPKSSNNIVDDWRNS